MSVTDGAAIGLALGRSVEPSSWSALRYFNFYRIVIAGLFAVLATTGKMPPSLTALDARLLAGTAILYLLAEGARSAMHRIRSDEVWFHHRGGGLRIHVLGDGPARAEVLERAGWAIPAPPATMFAWAPIPESFRTLGSLEFSKLLLEKAQVAVSPGIGFGEYGEGYVRIALVENEQRIRQAARNIKRFLADQPASMHNVIPLASTPTRTH